jgi:triacylglycerol lipase
MATIAGKFPPLWRESLIGLEAAQLLRSDVFRGIGVEPGDGQPVLLIPGFLAGDDSLALMTGWLRRTGHHTRKAGMRLNVNCASVAVEQLAERVESVAQERGQRVAIIGQSRGGSFAKVLAVRYPELVSGIVTLGSPQIDPLAVHPVVRAQVIAMGMLGTLGLRGVFSHRCRNGDCCESFWEDLEKPVPRNVRYLSVYSRRDGIVDWRACLDPSAEHLEIATSHCGMAVHPSAYEAVAAALADFRRRDRGARAAARRAAGESRAAA